MQERIEKLRRRFRSLGVASFFVTRPSNIRWLCGFTGSNSILFVTGKSAWFITDGRYTNQARSQVTGAEIAIYSTGKNAADAFIRELKLNKGIRFRGRVGIESPQMNVQMHETFKAAFPKCKTIETANVVEDLAQVKDADELKKIRKAVKATDKVFKAVLELIVPGVRESDIAAEIAYLHRKNGASKDAFETIVASGPRAALPHGIASSRKIRKGDFVTIDMGCYLDGYASDMTRTVVVGKASAKQKDVYKTVLSAQVAAAKSVTPNLKCSELDAVARKIITDAGYGDNFTHSLGHGLGLEVHARPVVSKVSKAKLLPGMVVTIEPGIYIDGWGGVRIEDDVLVTEDGYEILNKSPKKLLEL